MSSDDDDYVGRATKKTMMSLENDDESDYSGGFSSPDMSDDEGAGVYFPPPGVYISPQKKT